MAYQKISNQNLSSVEATFDFPSLPWVCQRRFAEICDGKTLNTFASINVSTRDLSKRSHSVRFIEIGCDLIKFHVWCYCKDDEHCNGLEAYQMTCKFNVLESISFINDKPGKLEAQFFQTLPINFTSTKRLNLIFHSADLSFIKTLITPNLESLNCMGRILFDISIRELKEVLSSLDKFNFEMYAFRELHSNADDILSAFQNLNCDEYFEMGSVVGIGKNYFS